MGSPRRLALVPVRGEASLDEAEDARLVVEARRGDERSFAELYRRYRDTVYRTCLRRLRDPAAADDVTQDTFLRAYSSLHRFDDTRRLLPWLISIATRRCIDVQRRGAKTSPTDDVELDRDRSHDEDPTLEAVVAVEERRRLERALRRLAPRQRRALLLHAIEGWSYADIAAAEGVSVSSTKSLLFHARDNLRRACRRGLLVTIAIPAGALRRRIRDLSGSVKARVHSAAEPLVNAVGGALAPSVSVVAIALTVIAPGGLPPSGASQFEPVASALVASTGGSAGTGPHLVGSSDRWSPPRDLSLAGSVLHPTKNATPEETQITAVTPSPNYEQDRTLFAAGRVPCQQSSCMVLFTSADGGHVWRRHPSEDFHGHTILLPPSYPTDPRIFAMGPSGLEVSVDGGDTFEALLPVQGDVAISPLFDRKDQRILIGASVVTEYWTNLDVAKPATLIGPAGTWLTVAFSPSYASDDTIFVGGIRPDAAGIMRPTVNRCAGSICESVVFSEGFDAPWLRPSPGFARDRTVYAFTSSILFRSVDGGTSFTAKIPSFAANGSAIRDILVAGDGVMFAAVHQPVRNGRGLYRSLDGGATWTGSRIPLPGFETGAARIVGLPDGRMIALGDQSGIACSADGGRSWNARCA